MGPIKADTVSDLKDLVSQLETRVRQLESRFGDGEVKPQTDKPPSMRMILMGPPGAGKSDDQFQQVGPRIDTLAGKGTQAPKIKDKYCVCHLV